MTTATRKSEIRSAEVGRFASDPPRLRPPFGQPASTESEPNGSQTFGLLG